MPEFGPISVICHTLSVSRSTAYDLINSGAIGSCKIGRARRVDLDSLAEYVAGLRGERTLGSEVVA